MTLMRLELSFLSRFLPFVYDTMNHNRKTCAFKNLHKEQYITIIISERRLTFKKHDNFAAGKNDSLAWKKELNLCLLHRGPREVEIWNFYVAHASLYIFLIKLKNMWWQISEDGIITPAMSGEFSFIAHTAFGERNGSVFEIEEDLFMVANFNLPWKLQKTFWKYF